MELDDTHHRLADTLSAGDPTDPVPDQASLLETPPAPEGFEARFEQVGEHEERMGFETRRQQAMVAAALFDEDPVPVKIGRFVVLRELGAGGMGVVYVAYDEQLDRRVAVKLLRGADPDSDARSRLAREAQAMARLQHPHVVTVHEVGEFEAQVFVAMEFVDGQDLRRWMQASDTRSWREVVALFIQAGRGLEAAHEVGLVHRDFKPDNVLVGKDGRARVADFGLAHAFDAQPQMREIGVDDSIGNQLATPLTRTGAIMGTPAYMAPEQYAGIRSDARGDQFSYCVALWEALYGERPFSGDSLFALSEAITRGRIEAPPEGSEVPAWLRAVLVRGLANDPEARWPAMGPLLDALGDDPQARRRRRVLWGGLGSATLGLVAGLSWLAVTQVQENARSSYWAELTEQLLGIERERGLEQANDDATRARDATRMSVLRSYQSQMAAAAHEDPTVAAVLLREVEGEARETETWLSTANELLGQELSHQVLQGHSSGVSEIFLSADGRSVYSGAIDGEVRRWDIASGASQVISPHEQQITGILASPDGRTIYSSSYDGSVRRWSADTGESEVLALHGRAIMGLDLDPEGRRLVTASKDGTIQLHDLREGGYRSVSVGGGHVYTARFDAAGATVITGTQDGKLRTWSVEREADAPLRVLEGHTRAVFHVRPLTDGRVVSGSDDGRTLLWASDGSARVLTLHPTAISALDLSDSELVSGASDGSILVAKLDTLEPARALPTHGSSVWSVAFSPDGKHIASASFDGTARLTRADGRGITRTFVGHEVAVVRVAIDPSGRWLWSTSYDRDIRKWDLARELPAVELEGHTQGVRTAEADADGQRVVTASFDGSARVWDVHDGTCLHVLAGGTDKLCHALFSPDGRRVAVARTVGDIELWELEDDTRRVLTGHDKTVWRLSFDGSGELLASASYDETVRLWDVSTGALRHTLRGHGGRVLAVDLQPDGTRVASASDDGELRIWDARAGSLAATLTGHTGKITTLLRAPDGRTLATGSDDGSARVWPSDDPADAIILPGHGQLIWSMSFDAKGERIATASHDARVRIFDARSGELLELLDDHNAELWGVEFLPNGQLLSASADQTLRLWGPDAGALSLTGHHAPVLGVEVLDAGRRALSFSPNGKLLLWRLDLLQHDTAAARARLEAVSRHCLTVEQRVRELGEDPGEARAARERCRSPG